MFDIASSKLLILGLVALIVIGPKDLPALLRTLGKYMGMIRKHANDFRSQFEDAMRESELDELKKQVQNVGQETEAAMREAETSIEKHLGDARAGIDPSEGEVAASLRACESTVRASVRAGANRRDTIRRRNVRTPL